MKAEQMVDSGLRENSGEDVRARVIHVGRRWFVRLT
jgi:hypothetical protein